MENLIVRKLLPTDNLQQISRLIYYTDDYVFPYLFNSDIEKAERVLTKMVLGDTLYHYQNITVGFLGQEIVGLIVAKEAPVRVNFSEMVRCFIDAGEPIDERFSKTYNEYYKLLENEPEGVYIANVCVDKNYRGKGVGSEMLRQYFESETKKLYNLETVKDNKAALKLYQKHGFEIVEEYLGFTEVPCYRMVRKR